MPNCLYWCVCVRVRMCPCVHIFMDIAAFGWLTTSSNLLGQRSRHSGSSVTSPWPAHGWELGLPWASYTVPLASPSHAFSWQDHSPLQRDAWEVSSGGKLSFLYYFSFPTNSSSEKRDQGNLIFSQEEDLNQDPCLNKPVPS